MDLQSLRADVRRMLNDASVSFWANDEIDRYLQQAYRLLTRTTRCVWDQRYLENLPATFSYTQPWERAAMLRMGFDAGCANYTYADERRMLDEVHAIGPANHTADFEFTDGTLEASGASVSISATGDLPATVSEIDRALWDEATIGVIRPGDAERMDNRYELTTGEVIALVPVGNGLRTLRKVRVPSAAAAFYDIDGSWGALRDPSDCSSGTVSGTWGVPRQLPGHHPMGDTGGWGLARRPYRDGTNVRIEHWREGRAVTSATDVFELPTRGAIYLRDYAISQCYGRRGPAQDLRLAQHYEQRWQRGVGRVQRRVTAQQRLRVGRMGGGVRPTRHGPPRPRLPWQFGTVVR